MEKSVNINFNSIPAFKNLNASSLNLIANEATYLNYKIGQESWICQGL